MILSDTQVGREITSYHTVRGLFPSQFSFRISISVSAVQEKVQLGTHIFNTSLPLGSSPYLTKESRLEPSDAKLMQLKSHHVRSFSLFYNDYLWPMSWFSICEMLR